MQNHFPKQNKNPLTPLSNACSTTFEIKISCFITIKVKTSCYTTFIIKNPCYTTFRIKNPCYTTFRIKNPCYTTFRIKNPVTPLLKLRHPVKPFIKSSIQCYNSPLNPHQTAHSLKLPQVSFLSRQKFCRDKHVFCHDKSMIATIKLFHDKIMFIMTSILFRQQKTHFVMTNVFVTTKVSLSQQNVCHNKIIFVVTNTCCNKSSHDKNVCHDKSFVMTSILLS